MHENRVHVENIDYSHLVLPTTEYLLTKTFRINHIAKHEYYISISIFTRLRLSGCYRNYHKSHRNVYVCY